MLLSTTRFLTLLASILILKDCKSFSKIPLNELHPNLNGFKIATPSNIFHINHFFHLKNLLTLSARPNQGICKFQVDSL